jgi:hypothetical protein
MEIVETFPQSTWKSDLGGDVEGNQYLPDNGRAV